jgi:uncharacterized protein YdaU (DUF1376 family)
MAEFPALPLWTDAFIADTIHLDATETGAYMMLLMCAWRSPDNSLPIDDKSLRKFSRCDAREWRRIRETVLAFWDDEDGRLRQKKLTKVRYAVSKKSRQAESAARVRWLKTKETPDADASSPHMQPKPKPKLVKKESKNLVPFPGNGTRKPTPYPDGFEAFWKAYPKRPTDTKSLAFKAWSKALKLGQSEPDLIAAAERYAAFASDTGHETKLVKTWVNAEGWTAKLSAGELGGEFTLTPEMKRDAREKGYPIQ